ncbi:MAG: beta-glucosidase [Eubacterium sp.]|nr:beta-glucosidase [Eubacterium sp.]
MSFSKDFVWGAASASYQIEGGAGEDGKGLSVWDVFSHRPGKTFDGHHGDVAADAYHRFEEDLDIMASIGIKNYRFSLSWPRILPEGCGKVNKAGLSYYDRVVDGCLARGITPWITLYHWDLPYALYLKGGWLNRETALHFGEYARLVGTHFKGRVKHYMTINEPQCAIGMAHISGLHAPGTILPDSETFLSWHNILLAHGFAVRAQRESVPDASIGLASTGALTYMKDRPSKTPEGLAEAAFCSLPREKNPGWNFNHQWFLDPVCFGQYPDDPHNPWSGFTSGISRDDLDIISSPVDFIGLNIYNGTEVERDSQGQIKICDKYPGYPRNSLGWPVTPGVLYWGPRIIWERYKLPVYITENGQPCYDRIYADGKVHDADRIDYLDTYLSHLKKAAGDGVDIRGYFHWSFTDNYEWHSGYDHRFGLVYIDYRNQKRIPKDSAYWYRDLIRSNGENLSPLS